MTKDEAVETLSALIRKRRELERASADLPYQQWKISVHNEWCGEAAMSRTRVLSTREQEACAALGDAIWRNCEEIDALLNDDEWKRAMAGE